MRSSISPAASPSSPATSRGLGQYLGRALARAGADLVITSRKLDVAGGLPQGDRGPGPAGRAAGAGRARPRQHPADGATRRSAAYGKIDILVNNAGCNVRKPAVDVTWDDWNLILDTNLRGTFFVAQAVARHDDPAQATGGSSTSARSPASPATPGLAPYGASRGGVKQLTMSLADDWGLHGITVNCLAPGWFKTAQNAVLYENQEWVDYLCDRIPLKRPGQPATSTARWSSWPPTPAATSPGRRCWSTAASRPGRRARCRRSRVSTPRRLRAHRNAREPSPRNRSGNRAGEERRGSQCDADAEVPAAVRGPGAGVEDRA